MTARQDLLQSRSPRSTFQSFQNNFQGRASQEINEINSNGERQKASSLPISSYFYKVCAMHLTCPNQHRHFKLDVNTRGQVNKTCAWGWGVVP